MSYHGSGSAISKSKDEFKKYIRDVPDFPQKGVIFKDITNLLKDGEVFQKAVDEVALRFSRDNINVVCSVEARGFILGAAIAYKLGVGFVPVRKKGKLPWDTHQEPYKLEYGQGELEIHTDAISPGDNVLFVDDVMATGGTVKAVIDLIKKMKGKICCAVFLIELSEFEGRKKLEGVPIYSLIRY